MNMGARTKYSPWRKQSTLCIQARWENTKGRGGTVFAITNLVRETTCYIPSVFSSKQLPSPNLHYYANIVEVG